MRRERTDEVKRHLTPDEIEICALAGRAGTPSEAAVAHVEGCAACRGEVAALERLDRRLASLPYLETPPGFAARVMARVDLPLPWAERAWAAVRRRWALLAAGLAAATATTGAAAYWLFGRRELTPIELLAFLAEGAEALALRGAIAVGRFLYDLGVVEMATGVVDRIAPTEAAVAMGLLSLAGFGALWTMKRLAEYEPARAARRVRG